MIENKRRSTPTPSNSAKIVTVSVELKTLPNSNASVNVSDSGDISENMKASVLNVRDSPKFYNKNTYPITTILAPVPKNENNSILPKFLKKFSLLISNPQLKIIGGRSKFIKNPGLNENTSLLLG